MRERDELLALAQGALRVINGEEKAKTINCNVKTIFLLETFLLETKVPAYQL